MKIWPHNFLHSLDVSHAQHAMHFYW